MRQEVVTRGYARTARVPCIKVVWTKLYGVWNAMNGRCNSPGTKDYKRYGARGIRVCDEWGDYDEFRAWAITHGFRKGLTLDRIDSNGNYEPDNCRWIPKGEQQLNTRRTHQLTVGGETKPLPTWAKLYGLDPHQIRGRLRAGWSHEHAVTIPPGARRGVPRRARSAYGRMDCPTCGKNVSRTRNGPRKHPCGFAFGSSENAP